MAPQGQRDQNCLPEISIEHGPTAFWSKLFQKPGCLATDIKNHSSVDESTKKKDFMCGHSMICHLGMMNSVPRANASLQIVELSAYKQ